MHFFSFEFLHNSYHCATRRVATYKSCSSFDSALNLLKLTEILGTNKYERYVWNTDKLSLRHIEHLQDLFNGNLVSDRTAVRRIVTWLDRTVEQNLTSDELLVARKPEKEDIERSPKDLVYRLETLTNKIA